jgi:hypothetical protein
MSVFAGFGTAYNEQRDRNYRKRVEVAKAFEEFKRNNPYATVQDYQQYIDGMSGGSNYLRGGMPSGQVLENLAADNAKRKELDDLNNYLGMIQKQAQVDGALKASIDDAVLNYTGDLGSAAETFLQGIPGINENDALKTRIMGKFNTNYYNQLVRDQVQKNMPSAITYLENVVDPTAVTPEEIQQNLGVTLDIAKGLHSGATAKWNQAQDALKIEKEGILLSLAGSSLVNGMNAAELRPILEQRATTLGIKPDAPFIDGIIANAEREFTVQENERLRQLELAAKNRSAGIIDGYVDREANAALIRRGDVDSWKTNLLEQLKDRMSDEEFELQFGVKKDAAAISLMDRYYEAQLEAQRLIQNESQQQRREKSAEQMRTYSSEYTTKNAERAANGIGKMGDIGAALAGQLASRFDMNAQANLIAMSVLQEVMESNDDATPAEIYNAIVNNPEFQAVAPSVVDAQQAYAGQIAQLNSTFDVDTFDNYMENLETASQTDQQAMNENFSALLEVQDPAQRIAALQALKNGIQQWTEQTTTMHTAREQRQDRWVEYGTGGWNQDRADSFLGSMQENSQQMYGKIDAAIAEAEQQIADTTSNTITASGSIPESLSFVLTEMGPEGQNLPTETYEQRVDYVNKMIGAMGSQVRHPRTGKVLYGREEEAHYADMLKAFFGNEGGVFSSSSGVREAIASDPAKFAQFIQNPIAYMMQDTEFLQLNPIFDPQNPDNPYGVGGQ